MFRKLTREKQALSSEECMEILRTQPRGVLSVLGDDGYPYGLPINFYYDEESGRLIFHGGMTGHRIDAMNRCDKASFCVYDSGYRRQGEWALNIKSVIIFGRLSPIDDEAEAVELCRKLSLKYTDDVAYIEKEIRSSAAGTLCIQLVPEHITGKLVNES